MMSLGSNVAGGGLLDIDLDVTGKLGLLTPTGLLMWLVWSLIPFLKSIQMSPFA